MVNPDLVKDFRNTLWFIWKYLKLPDPTPVQYDIASFLADPSNDRCIVEGFRGVGKSWITSALSEWFWLVNPDLRILVVSGSRPRADKFAQFTRRLIYDIPEFAYLKPGRGQRDAVNSFDVGPASNHHAPSLLSIGITGQLTGNRADIIIADDVETSNNSGTQSARDTLREQIKELECILTPGGRIIYLGTPQYEGSIYNDLRKSGYTCRIYPARFPSQKQIEGYEGALAPFLAKRLEANPKLEGHPTDPQRFTHGDLLKREAALGRSTFQLQYQLDTTLSDAERFPLKIADLILHPLAVEKGPISLAWSSAPQYIANDIPSSGFSGDVWRRSMFPEEERIPYIGTVMSIDPAGSGGDEVGYAVIKYLNGRLFLTACGGLLGGYGDANLKLLASIAKAQMVNHMVIEGNMGDGMFLQLMKPIISKYHPCSMEEVKSTIQKERRIIDTLEPVMNQHRLVVAEDVAINDYKENRDKRQRFSLFWQMTHITKDRDSLLVDDRLDALALAVAYWKDAMARDTDKAAEDAQLELQEAEIRRIEESWNIYRDVPDTWVHLPE